jgi:hypothetical protein
LEGESIKDRRCFEHSWTACAVGDQDLLLPPWMVNRSRIGLHWKCMESAKCRLGSVISAIRHFRGKRTHRGWAPFRKRQARETG